MPPTAALQARIAAGAAPEEHEASRMDALDDPPRDVGQQLVGDGCLGHGWVRREALGIGPKRKVVWPPDSRTPAGLRQARGRAAGEGSADGAAT